MSLPTARFSLTCSGSLGHTLLVAGFYSLTRLCIWILRHLLANIGTYSTLVVHVWRDLSSFNSTTTGSRLYWIGRELHIATTSRRHRAVVTTYVIVVPDKINRDTPAGRLPTYHAHIQTKHVAQHQRHVLRRLRSSKSHFLAQDLQRSAKFHPLTSQVQIVSSARGPLRYVPMHIHT